ncbi:hypothetical protein FQR65_LT11902 [Abscondita terminalis]|nr:hypothetical protein FQR65_LT11902 [Abscondita terminalis]
MRVGGIQQGVQGEVESDGPSESECRPHIEKALKQFEAGETEHETHAEDEEDLPTVEITTDELLILDDQEQLELDKESGEIEQMDVSSCVMYLYKTNNSPHNDNTYTHKTFQETQIDSNDHDEDDDDDDDDNNKNNEDNDNDDIPNTGDTEDTNTSTELEEQNTSTEDMETQNEDAVEESENVIEIDNAAEVLEEEQNDEPIITNAIITEDIPDEVTDEENNNLASDENIVDEEEATGQNDETGDNIHKINVDSAEDQNQYESEHSQEEEEEEEEELQQYAAEEEQELQQYAEEEEPEQADQSEEQNSNVEVIEETTSENIVLLHETISMQDNYLETPANDNIEQETTKSEIVSEDILTEVEENEIVEVEKTDSETEEPVVEELMKSNEEVLENLRPRDHVSQLLKLDTESVELENIFEKTSDIVLKELKKLYENAIKPLETLYKYRDLSNRHFGDSEIFSKPLILFMGPWSGGKSSIINYLLDIEHNELNLHTGAEPSPAYFNILMHGPEPEILDGTELSADYTFSGLQKFGQGLEERLRGYKFPSKLLEKVNIVEIPGILEVRKQVSRIFPFNDACQWFIDRADIIFLVYDPSKLDVGPETEAILDQLKGREHQTRIVLNKADQVKPEELMRVQGALIWNISPLMSSAQPPVMYTTSLWSQPYEQWAPVRLLQAQERAFLRDLRSAIDKRIDNKIASARRFAVRVRNHAKMVDCYLTTYFNHKSVFGNRKQVSDEIINHPQDYHIYEGLSTLTNISRYDLPDPDVYRDFFRLNALYDFQKLSSTCTYFRGCPINRLDVAIAYDLPELVGKHKRLIEAAFSDAAPTKTSPGS